MKYVFFSTDFGALVFGREILKKNPTAELEFWVKVKVDKSDKNSFCERDFWETGIGNSAKESKFGRIGIFLDRENFEAKNFFTSSNFEKLNKEYSPKNPRSEKKLQISIFEIQILKQMANEGLADSVEFRRLARKFIRRAKNANVDTILFADAIFGAEVARKVLQHLAGTRIKCVFLADCLGDEFFKKSEGKGSVEISTGDDIEFTRGVAEKILRKKVGQLAINN